MKLEMQSSAIRIAEVECDPFDPLQQTIATWSGLSGLEGAICLFDTMHDHISGSLNTDVISYFLEF